jgi:hypothetical protein
MELKIEKKTAKKLYSETPEWFQKVLTETFGDECFKTKNFDEIKTLEDAAEATGHSVGYLRMQDPESTDEWAYRMLKMVIKAINQGWTPDWDNTNQRKWWPYFKLSSGFGFSGSNYDYGITFTFVGSRLCFESEAKSNYAANQFIDIYEQFLTVKK